MLDVLAEVIELGHPIRQLVIALMVTTFAAAGCQSKDRLPPVAEAVAEEITLSQLLSSPNKFDGSLVRVIGMCSIAFEGNALRRPEDGSNWIGMSPAEVQRAKVMSGHSIWLDLGWPVSPAVRTLNGKYALIEGRFDLASKGHGGMYQGTLRDIRRIEESSADADAAVRRRAGR